MFYSKSTGGFYSEDIHGPRLIDGAPNPDCKIPLDAVEISESDWLSLLDAQSLGQNIQTDADGNPVAVAPPAPSLSDLKASRLIDLNTAAQALANQATASYPDFEMQTWPDQRREAMAWQSDNTTLTPYVDAMAGYRGIDRTVLLAKIVAAVAAFTAFATKVVGLRQKYADQIDAATTEAALNAIAFDFS
jgi:hypothetical protein